MTTATEIKKVYRPLSATHKARVVDSISETERLIAKEEKYSTDLRDHGRVAHLREHLENLHAMLAPDYLHGYPDLS